VECVPRADISCIPRETRGIYALLNLSGKNYNVVYIGMARARVGIRGRLNAHAKAHAKKRWSHFSVFEVWPNIDENEIQELEGLFRHVFRHDANANSIAKQKSFKKLSILRKATCREWKAPYKG